MDDIKDLVNRVLDDICAAHDLPNDEALARHLKVPSVYVWRWRRGIVGKTAFNTLAPYMYNASHGQKSTPSARTSLYTHA